MFSSQFVATNAHFSFAQSTSDWLAAQHDAETRAAIAEAERAKLFACLPPSTSKTLSGRIEVKQFGAAGQVKAFDRARQLAFEVCAALHFDRKTIVYERATEQGLLATRLVVDAIDRLDTDLGICNNEMQQVIDLHIPQGTRLRPSP